MEQFFAKASYNFDKLLEEIRASYPLANLSTGNGIDNTSGIRVQMPDGTQQATMDAIGAIITAHNASVLTENQQVVDAQANLALQAKAYFGKQYLKASPDTLDTIFTAVKQVVDAKAAYVTIQANRYAIMRVAYGWPQVQDISTAAGKARYLETIQSLIAIYS